MNQGPKEEIYPIPFWPRLYRWEMINQLQNYLDDEKNASLYAFAWWFKKWKAEFTWEYVRAKDLEFAGAELENAPDKEDFLKEFNLFYEAQILGPMANKVLGELDLKNWREEYENGISPLEILATLYKAKKQPISPELQREFLNRSIAFTETVDTDGRVDAVIQQLSAKSAARYVISHKNIEISPHTPSYILYSFFNFSGLTEVQFYKLSTPVELKGKNLQLVIPATEIWTTTHSSPCGEGMATVLTTEPNFGLESKPKARQKKLIRDSITWFCY